MPRKEKGLIDVSQKRPATEENCAKDANYIYLENSKISEEIRRDIETLVKEELEVKPLMKCKCVPKNGECCVSPLVCPNKKRKHACVECNPACKNNPWENKSFAIEQQTLCTHHEKGKGWGLYAREAIPKNTFLGEYKGVLTKEIPNDDSLEYLMVLKHGLGVYINPFLQGSGMRLINNACYPSAKAITYMHDGLYKCIFVTTRNIKAGEEVTINYGWTYNRRIQERPKCVCGHPACLEVLGDFNDDEDQRFIVPSPFRNVTTRASEAKLKQLNSIPILNHLDLNRREDHLFGAEEPVAVITMPNKQLRVSVGKVIECFVTEHKLYFYVVRVVEQRIIDYTVPMWFVFRNIEVAEAMLDKVFTKEEKETMEHYFTSLGERCNPTNAKKRANIYEGEILYTYVKRFLDENIPKFEKRERKVVGSSSLGVNSVYLEIVLEPDVQSDPPVHGPIKPTTGFPMTGREVCILEEKAANLQKFGLLNLLADGQIDLKCNAPTPTKASAAQSIGVGLGLQSTSLAPPRSSSAIKVADGRKAYNFESVDNLLKELGIISDEDFEHGDMVDYENALQFGGGYSVSSPLRDINKVVENCKNEALFKRFFQHAVEQLSIITLWRCPLDVTINFEDVYQQLEKELYRQYYAQRPRDRRFLLMEHYRVMCEIVKPGSFNLRYCSLCEMTHNYESLDFWNAHFRECHEIGAALYRCQCDEKYETRYVSEFRRHVEICSPELHAKLSTNLPDHFVDSFADYLTLRAEKGKMRHLLVPGQALVVADKKQSPKKGKSANFPLVNFLPDTLMPVDDNIIMKPHSFQIQQTATQLKEGWTFHVPENPQSVFELSKLDNMRRVVPSGREELIVQDSSNDIYRTDSKYVSRKRRVRRTNLCRDTKISNDCQAAGTSSNVGENVKGKNGTSSQNPRVDVTKKGRQEVIVGKPKIDSSNDVNRQPGKTKVPGLLVKRKSKPKRRKPKAMKTENKSSQNDLCNDSSDTE